MLRTFICTAAALSFSAVAVAAMAGDIEPFKDTSRLVVIGGTLTEIV